MRLTHSTLALIAAALTPWTANANLLDDGDFDLATSGSITSNSDWSLVSNVPNDVDFSAQFQVGGFARSDGAAGSGAGIWYRSFAGSPTQGGDSELTQTVAAPESGDYLLTFEAARETNFTADEWLVSLSSDGTGGSGVVDLLAAAIPEGNFNQVQVVNGGPGAAAFSIRVDGVTAGDMLTVTTSMVNGVDAGVNPQSAFIDRFSLTTIPEPTSALIALFGMFGLAGHRR